MKILVNYANDKYRKAQRFNTFTGKFVAGFDRVYEFADKDIDEKFYNKNKAILDFNRGNGLWLWKPYFIKKVYDSMRENDVLFYADSASYFIGNVNSIIDSVDEKNIWISQLPLLEKQFTHPDTLDLMGCNDEQFKESNQLSASFLMFKKSDLAEEFINEWLELCYNIDILYPKNTNNLPEYFIGHREDQSIISLLAKKYQLKAYKDPSQFGKYPYMYNNFKGTIYTPVKCAGDYGVKIIHHRTNLDKVIMYLKPLVYTMLPKWFVDRKKKAKYCK